MASPGPPRRPLTSFGSWAPASQLRPLAQARYIHTAVLLADGRVLVVGGSNGRETFATAEIYDPERGVWQSAARMSVGRSRHTATVLKNGLVLVVGGSGRTNLAEIYDPEADRWFVTRPMITPRHMHTACLLADGRVLVTGGFRTGFVKGNQLDTAEVYNPGTNAWTEAGPLTTARSEHAAVTLATGEVLIIGGSDGRGYLASADLYAPDTLQATAIGRMAIPRARHAATLLDNGRVLITGGIGVQRDSEGALRVAELFDPGTGPWLLTSGWSGSGTFERVADLISEREGHTATLLEDGNVLVCGGHDRSGRPQRAGEIFLTEQKVWTAIGSMSTARRWHTATRLRSGQVLIVGGLDAANQALNTIELYDPKGTG